MHALQKHGLGVSLLVVLALALGACGSGNGQHPSTAFLGTVSGSGGQSGTLTVNVQAAVARAMPFAFISTAYAQDSGAVVAAAGLLALAGGGGSVNLTGSYDTGSGALSLTGSGFAFTGAIAGGQMNGTYAGPNGVSGAFSGSNATKNTIAVLCGTFTGTTSGVWNVVIASDNSVSGVAAEESGQNGAQVLHGTLSDTTFTVTDEGGDSATGAVSGDAVSGTWQEAGGASGTFQASKAACQ